MSNPERERVPKSYFDLVVEAASPRAHEPVMTIPRGFIVQEPSKDMVRQQKLLRQFDKLVLDVEVAARERSA